MFIPTHQFKSCVVVIRKSHQGISPHITALVQGEIPLKESKVLYIRMEGSDIVEIFL